MTYISIDCSYCSTQKQAHICLQNESKIACPQRFIRFLRLYFGQLDIMLLVKKTLAVFIFIYECLMISKENDLSPSVTILVFGIDSRFKLLDRI